LHCLSNKTIECVVLDTMGIDAKIKSILSDYHGRYHTVGFANLRAVSIDMTPIFSGVCRSTDSEAMNIVEVIDEVKEICGDAVKIYTGNGHTTTKNLDEESILRLKKNITLLNKIGKLLKD
jgi:hypothetical protein